MGKRRLHLPAAGLGREPALHVERAGLGHHGRRRDQPSARQRGAMGVASRGGKGLARGNPGRGLQGAARRPDVLPGPERPGPPGLHRESLLKADKTGFTWEITPGKTVTVGFSTPLAAQYFELGNKGQIRCMFYDAPIAIGKLEQTMTIALPEGGKVVPSLEERYAADTTGWFTRRPWIRTPPSWT